MQGGLASSSPGLAAATRQVQLVLPHLATTRRMQIDNSFVSKVAQAFVVLAGFIEVAAIRYNPGIAISPAFGLSRQKLSW